MKCSLIYTALLSSMLLITGCGSGESSDLQNTEQNEKPSDIPLTQQKKEKILIVSEQSHHIAAKESLSFGIVDTAIYGINEIVEEDKQCNSGRYTNINGVVNFNECAGLFYKLEASQYQSLIAKSGTVTIKNGEYIYQNLVLENPETKETLTITGSLKSDVNDSSATLTTNNLIVNTSEKTQSGFINVKYIYEKYRLNYNFKSDAELSISTNGTLSIVNSPVGDYKVDFVTSSPFGVRINEDGGGNLPSQGEIKIEDVNNQATTTLSVIPNTNNVQYTVTSENEKLLDRVQTWEKTFSSEKNESNNNDQKVTKPLIQRIKVPIGSTTILPSGPGNKARAFCWQTTPNKNLWRCDGRKQLLIASWKINEALDLVGCGNGKITHQNMSFTNTLYTSIRTKKGDVYDCGYDLDDRMDQGNMTYNRDITRWWDNMFCAVVNNLLGVCDGNKGVNNNIGVDDQDSQNLYSEFNSFIGVVGGYQDYDTNVIKSAKGCSVVRSGKNLTVNIPSLNVSVSVQANSLEVQPSTGGQGLLFITGSEDKSGHMQNNDGPSEKVIRSAWIVLDKKSYSCSDYDK